MLLRDQVVGKLQVCRLVVFLPRFWEDETVVLALSVNVRGYLPRSSLVPLAGDGLRYLPGNRDSSKTTCKNLRVLCMKETASATHRLLYGPASREAHLR